MVSVWTLMFFFYFYESLRYGNMSNQSNLAQKNYEPSFCYGKSVNCLRFWGNYQKALREITRGTMMVILPISVKVKWKFSTLTVFCAFETSHFASYWLMGFFFNINGEVLFKE